MTSDELWIRRFHPAPRHPTRLVMFPHAGGSASYFFPFSDDLSAHTDVLVIQYPGRQNRLAEPLIDDVHELADAVLVALLPLLDRPFVLFGHSMGASVAFELAARLEHGKGIVPACLIVSGRRAPADVRDNGVYLLDDDGLVAELTSDGGTDPRVLAEPELRDLILPAVRSDFRAAETYTYRPGPPLSCPVVALTGDADSRMAADDALLWRTYTTGPFERKVFSGGHFYLAEHRAAVVDEILRWTGRQAGP